MRDLLWLMLFVLLLIGITSTYSCQMGDLRINVNPKDLKKLNPHLTMTPSQAYHIKFTYNFDGWANKDCEFWFKSKKIVDEKFLHRKIKEFLAINRPWYSGEVLNLNNVDLRKW